MSEFERWMEEAAAEAIEDLSPSLARNSKGWLETGVAPARIMQMMRKTIMDSSVLDLLELALEHWKGQENVEEN